MLKRYLLYFLCLVSAMGCAPYGFKFIYMFNLSNAVVAVILGIVFAICSVLLNAILGVYSFLSVPFFKDWHGVVIFFLSLIASIPTGFICYYGYINSFPTGLVIGLSLVVTFINAFISNSAMYQLSSTMFLSPKKAGGEYLIFLTIGSLLGVFVSLVFFLSTFRGVLSILSAYHISHAVTLAVELSIISWLPLACLYINANQMIFIKIHQLIFSKLSLFSNFSLTAFIAGLLALCSGASLAEIANEAIIYLKMNPDMLHSFFINISTTKSLQLAFIILCFISSAAVNFIALKKIKHL